MLRGGGRGVLLALVLQRGGRWPLLQNTLINKSVGREVGLGGQAVVDLAGRQGMNDRLGAAQLDGSIEDVGVELQVALHGLWKLVGTRGDGPLAGAAHWRAGWLDKGISDRSGGAAEVELAAIVLASTGEDVGHEARHLLRCVARVWRERCSCKLSNAARCLRSSRVVADAGARGKGRDDDEATFVLCVERRETSRNDSSEGKCYWSCRDQQQPASSKCGLE